LGLFLIILNSNKLKNEDEVFDDVSSPLIIEEIEKPEISDTIKKIDYDGIIIKYSMEELNDVNLAKALVELEIDAPKWVFKQAKHETGNFESVLCIKGNNLFGMRIPAQRKTTALKTKYRGYATFEYWISSVVDYKYWQLCRERKPDEKYIKYLIRRGYAADKKYGTKLKSERYNLENNIMQIFADV
jgi:uncharacterized FlgJ-related protein